MSLIQFSNEQVSVESLPSIGSIEYKGLHKEYLTAEMIGLSILWLILGSGALIFIFFNPANLPGWILWALTFVLVFLISFSYFITYAGFKKKKYALREKDIIYKCGLIWRLETVIPFSRIQHAEVRQGPIERLFNLSKLNIYTAGGGASDLSISGLLLKEAEAIKHFLLNKTAVDEEE